MKRYVIALLVAGLALAAQSAVARAEATAFPSASDNFRNPWVQYAPSSEPAALITAIPTSSDRGHDQLDPDVKEPRINPADYPAVFTFPSHSND